MEYLVEINNVKYKQIGKYILPYNQLWADGSGRNYGDYRWSGTVAGNFTPIKFNLQIDTKEELSALITYLERGIFNVKFYEHKAMGYVTREFYRANFEVNSIYLSDDEQIYDPIEFEFTPVERW